MSARDSTARNENAEQALEDLEAQLLRSEELLRLASVTSRAYSFEWKIESGEMAVSEEAASILGLEPGHARREPVEACFARVHPEDREPLVALALGLSPERDTYRSVHRVRRADGTWLWLDERARGFFDERGRLVRLIGISADVTERKHAEEALQRSEDRLRYLAEASAALASSLDLRTTLHRLAQLSVPRLADGCVVDMLREDGRLERLAAVSTDPKRVDLAFEVVRRWPIDLRDPGGIGELLRTGAPRYRRALSDEDLRRMARDEAHLEMLRAFGMRSTMIVPLQVEGRTVGALTLTMAESGRLYEEQDLELAVELARRASLSIENAQLYTRAEQARARIERVQALTAALSRAATVEDAAAAVFSEGISRLGAARALVGIVEDGHFRALIGDGFPDHLLERYRRRIPVDRMAIVRELALAPEPVYARDREALLARYPDAAAVVAETGRGARAFVPLVTGARLVGLLSLGFEEPRDFSADERALLEAVGRLAAQAFERAGLTSALEEQRARLRSILDNAPSAIFVTDRGRRLVEGNRALAELLGRPLEDAVGRLSHEVFPDDLAAKFHADDERVIEGGEVEEHEDVIHKPDGARTYLTVKFPIRDTSGHPHGVGAIATDITERKRIEETLAERERALRALADSVPELVWAADPRGVGDFFNRRWREYTGAEHRGASWLEGVHPEDRARVDEQWARSVATHEPYEVEMRLRASDGSYRWFLVRGLPFRDARGRVARWFGTCTDIDEQRRAREEAERASRLKDEFLATLSHELRTPLTAIDGWVQILRRSKGDPARTARAIDVIERSARTQAQLVDDILDVSRIVSGQLRVRSVPVHLDEVIRAALDVVRPSAEARGVRIESHLQRRGVVRGDPQRLQQVVWNLLSNAVKFSQAGGAIAVRLESRAGEAAIVIEDAGQGIRSDFLPYVFERFSQADASFTRRHGGLGVGLAIVRHLVELHGGSVEAFSEGEGRGARFTVRLPLLSGEVAAPPEAAREGRDLAGLRVLIVDDEPDTRELLAELFEPCGAEVQAVGSADEGLRVLRREPIDVIVSDLGMSGVEGLSFLKEVRALPAETGGGTPAIALTAYTRGEDRSRALRAGFQSFLTKPVDTGELLRTVAHLAGRPHAAR